MMKCTKKGMDISKSLANKLTLKQLSEIKTEKTSIEKAVDWGTPKLKDLEKHVVDSLNSKSYKNISNKIAVVGALWASNTFFLAITSAIVCIGITLWLTASGKIITKLKSKPNLLEKLRSKVKKYFGDSEDDLPDELQPPDIAVPNVAINLSESITSHMIDRVKITSAEVIIKIVFLLLLKAVLSLYMVESLATAIAIIAALFTPGLNLITYLLLWMSIGVCTIVKYFKRPKVTMSYEKGSDADD